MTLPAALFDLTGRGRHRDLEPGAGLREIIVTGDDISVSGGRVK